MWKWTNTFAPKETEFVELVNVDDEKSLRRQAKAKNSTLDERITYCTFMLNKYPQKREKYMGLLKELHEKVAEAAQAAKAAQAAQAKATQAKAAQAKATQAKATQAEEEFSDDDGAVGSSNGSNGSEDDSDPFREEVEGGKKSRHSKKIIKHRHSRRKTKSKSKRREKKQSRNKKSGHKHKKRSLT